MYIFWHGGDYFLESLPVVITDTDAHFFPLYGWNYVSLYQQDKDFGKNLLYKAHNNPPAKVYTSLRIYQQYTLEKVYEGQNFLWASAPVAGDYIRFTFLNPLEVEK